MPTIRECVARAAILLAIGAAGCVTGSGSKTGSGNLTNEQIAARNEQLNALAATLSACSTKGKPTDNGLVAVTAKSDGTVAIDAWQWQGGAEMRACIDDVATKARLGVWGGGSMSAVWAVGTADHPPPGPLANIPGPIHEKLTGFMAQIGDSELGPMTACAQRNLPPETYAMVVMRIVVFPDGKVVGATPVKIDGEGRDAPFVECLRAIPLEWKFPPFAGPGFVTTDVAMKRGINPNDRL